VNIAKVIKTPTR